MTSSSQTKARRVLLEAGPTMTLERLIAFGRKLFGRDPTPDEIAYMKKELPHLPER